MSMSVFVSLEWHMRHMTSRLADEQLLVADVAVAEFLNTAAPPSNDILLTVDDGGMMDTFLFVLLSPFVMSLFGQSTISIISLGASSAELLLTSARVSRDSIIPLVRSIRHAIKARLVVGKLVVPVMYSKSNYEVARDMLASSFK